MDEDSVVVTYAVFSEAFVDYDSCVRYKNLILDKQSKFLQSYIWQYDPFNLTVHRLSQLSGNNIQNTTDSSQQECSEQYYLSGKSDVGDSTADEWIIVKLLLIVSQDLKDIQIQIQDNDGEFLLIEAAHEIPEWLDPDNGQNRVLLSQGNLHIVPEQLAGVPVCSGRFRTRRAVQCVREFPRETRAGVRVQAAIQRKLDEFGSAAIQQLQTCVRCTMPQSAAQLIMNVPRLIPYLVRKLINRKLADMHAAAKKRHYNHPELITVNVDMHTMHAALLSLQKFEVGKSAASAATPVEQQQLDMGGKITAALEMMTCEHMDLIQQLHDGQNLCQNQCDCPQFASCCIFDLCRNGAQLHMVQQLLESAQSQDLNTPQDSQTKSKIKIRKKQQLDYYQFQWQLSAIVQAISAPQVPSHVSTEHQQNGTHLAPSKPILHLNNNTKKNADDLIQEQLDKRGDELSELTPLEFASECYDIPSNSTSTNHQNGCTVQEDTHQDRVFVVEQSMVNGRYEPPGTPGDGDHVMDSIKHLISGKSQLEGVTVPSTRARGVAQNGTHPSPGHEQSPWCETRSSNDPAVHASHSPSTRGNHEQEATRAQTEDTPINLDEAAMLTILKSLNLSGHGTGVSTGAGPVLDRGVSSACSGGGQVAGGAAERDGQCLAHGGKQWVAGGAAVPSLAATRLAYRAVHAVDNHAHPSRGPSTCASSDSDDESPSGARGGTTSTTHSARAQSNDEFQQMYSSAMEAELSSSCLGHTFQRVSTTSTPPERASHQLPDADVGTSIRSTQHADVDVHMNSVDIDYNLASSIYESVTQSGGRASAGTNMLGMLGIPAHAPHSNAHV